MFALLTTAMYVAPYTGAWIEILWYRSDSWSEIDVAPYTGAWIEMPIIEAIGYKVPCRPLYGGVD